MVWEFDHLEDLVLNVLPKSQRILNMALKKSEKDSDLPGMIEYIRQLERIIHILLAEEDPQ